MKTRKIHGISTLIRSIVVIVPLPCAWGSAGAQGSAPSTWYWSVTIRYVYAGHVGNRVAFSVNEAVNAGSCPTYNNIAEFTLDPDARFFWQMYSMLLIAQRDNKPINVYTDGTCGVLGVNARDISIGNIPH